MSNARKYILNSFDIKSCGIGSVTGDTVQHNMLNTFTVISQNKTCVYPTLTVDQLTTLSFPAYSDRVRSFINKLEIENEIDKEYLYDTAFYDNDDCDVCKLNPNFIVYGFITGIRVIDVGYSRGILEYSIYREGGIDNGLWQTSGTFLNLDLEGVYVVKIRDLLDGVEICSYFKIVDVATLFPIKKKISFKSTCVDNIGDYKYNFGNIDITPPLISGEYVDLDIISEHYADKKITFSNVSIECKPSTSTTYTNVHYYYSPSPQTPPLIRDIPTLRIRYGDQLKYSVCSFSASISLATISTKLCLSSVIGVGNFVPEINTSCSIINMSLTSELKRIVVCLDSYYDPDDNVIVGRVKFNNEPIIGEYVTLTLRNVNEVKGLNATSCVKYTETRLEDIRKLTTIVTNDSSPTIVKLNYLNNYDRITLPTNASGTFCVELVAPNPGDESYVNITIDCIESNVCATQHPTYNNITCRIVNTNVNTVLSVCRENYTCNPYYLSASDGFINITPPLAFGQSIEGYYNYCQVSPNQNICNCIVIWCKKNGLNVYSKQKEIISNYCEDFDFGKICMNYGDSVCYQLESTVKVDYPDYLLDICNGFMFDSIDSSVGVVPAIQNDRNGDYLIQI